MVTAMTRRLTGALSGTLRAAPATVPALAAIVLLLIWAASQGGYPLTHWAPGALIVLALLGLTLSAVPLRLAEIPPAVRLAALCLAGYTVLSFLSILWSGSPGDAWEGADRTLLYLLIFLLFALWPGRGDSALLLLTAWTLAMISLALFVTLHLGAGDHGSQFPGGRLMYPTGYPNASAAQWLMVFWPALLLARSGRLHPCLRGVLAGGAVLLAGLALLSQSRGSLYATPLMVLAVFALLPGRLRSFMLLVPVAAGLGAATPTLLHASERIQNGGDAHAAMHSVIVALFAAALTVGLVVMMGAAIERRGSLSPQVARRARRGVGALAVLTLLAVIAGGLIVAGNPITRIESGWHSFKVGYGADTKGNHLVSGLGSNRYDFYRVALNEFVAHPVAGIGVDNFFQQYLLHGRSDETPRYPHSVELRTLAETGILGALLALVGLGAALLAAFRAIRAPDPVVGAVAAAALACFGYWVLQGSFDWFWEFAGLGGPAFALLGLACALEPRRTGREARAAPTFGSHRAVRLSAAVAVAVTVVLAAVVLAAPWLSQRQVQSAAQVWTRSPATAYARLDEAAELNPLSDGPYLVAGSIALRFNDFARADRQFALALGRVPTDAYATLERGAIASTRGDQRAARVLLTRAVALNPRDPLAQSALRDVLQGRRVEVNQLNRSILVNTQQIS
jgi:hypothetical protein